MRLELKTGGPIKSSRSVLSMSINVDAGVGLLTTLKAIFSQILLIYCLSERTPASRA